MPLPDMAAFFASGRVADFLLLVLGAEALALLIYHRLTGCGPRPATVFSLLLPGAFFMLGLRAALTGAWWGWVSLSLIAALLAHLWDLRGRWRD